MMDFKFGHNTWYLPNPHPRNPTPQNPDSSFSPLSRRSCQSPDWNSISISISKLDLDLDPSQLVFSSLSVSLLKLLQFLIGIQVRTPSRKLSTSSSSSDCLLIRQQLQVKRDIVLRVLVLWSHLFRFSLSFDIACCFVE
ncbi:uncharacterized protein LOC109824907 [Asparagus officinalis]|uniref:uncharacterized protein LOC109824907 n=1 Tax=Asparagus officinalis TaxID=4686 RepID=UPI00098E84EB|nr:uncharacterized protein LOC109824907 [Asparagus officinalis]